MRAVLLLPLALIPLLAGCTSDYDRNTGITCATAVRIAEDHNARHFLGGEAQYRPSFRNVQRADWDPSDRIWLVDLSSPDGYYAREYKINREGMIVGYNVIGRGTGPDYAPAQFDDGYAGAEWPGNTDTADAPSPVGEAPK